MEDDKLEGAEVAASRVREMPTHCVESSLLMSSSTRAKTMWPKSNGIYGHTGGILPMCACRSHL